MPTPNFLEVAREPHGRVWRVGYKPDPWAWPDWKWAQGGRFHGRWDDREGTFRTLYVANSLLGCLLEVLAPLRPDPTLASEISAIVEVPEDVDEWPTVAPGEVDPGWLESRAGGHAELSGNYCSVSATGTVATLRPHFISYALTLGRLDFDVAALKDGATRELTQAVSTRIYETTDLAGLQFASRHGDDLLMWAIFERAGEPPISPRLSDVEVFDLEMTTPEVVEAFQLHGLRWLGQAYSAPLPLPLVEIDEPDELFLARHFGAHGPVPTTPLGAALLWNAAITDPVSFKGVLERLTVDTAWWGDFSGADSILSKLSMTTNPIVDPDEPERVAHVKFIAYSGDMNARSVGAAALDDVWLLTLRRDASSPDECGRSGASATTPTHPPRMSSGPNRSPEHPNDIYCPAHAQVPGETVNIHANF